MKQGYFLLITLMFSMGLQAQTLKETIRGKFGEYLKPECVVEKLPLSTETSMEW